MGTGTVIVLIVLAFVLIVVFAIIGMFNNLVRLRNVFKNAFAQIDVQLKRRYDLIPNLVETAKGYIKHERETLEAVTKARNIAMAANQAVSQQSGNPQSMQALISAESGLAGALGRLMMVSESYPDLKANQTMAQLMEELTSTENKIAFARQFYNDTAMGYNTRIQMFPTNFIAGMFSFPRRDFFEVKEGPEREAPKVGF